jgi:putative flippase GtrA
MAGQALLMSTGEAIHRRDGSRPPRTAVRFPTVEIAVPVYNEAETLAASIATLVEYLGAAFPFTFHVTIVDNASTDGTWAIAEELAAGCENVSAIYLPEKGRGRALRAAWGRSEADVLSYMDVDLSTRLDALLPLVAPLVSGHSDLAIGSRLAYGARIRRGAKREVISRGYNLILRVVLRSRFSDAQCGFKAIRRSAAAMLLPLVEDDGWFFDTELLVLAQRHGLRIHEVPVDWVDDPHSSVAIVRTAVDDLKGVARLLRSRRLEHELGVFAAIGAASTLAYVALFAVLRPSLPAVEANALALLVTALANTAANRRLTFRRRGVKGALRDHLGGLAIFALGLGITSAAIETLSLLIADPSRAAELATLVLAGGLATLVRFVLLRRLVFAETERSSPTPLLPEELIR